MIAVVDQLKIHNGEYSLGVRVDDGTATTKAIFSDAVLTQLLEIPCSEFRLHTDMAAARMQEVANRLLHMEALMEIQFFSGTPKLPIVIKLDTDFDSVKIARALFKQYTNFYLS